MTRGGRPLRFILLVVGGWTALRVAMLWPQTGSLPAAVRGALPVTIAQTRGLPVLRRHRPVSANAAAHDSAARAVQPESPIATATPKRSVFNLPEARPAHDAVRAQFALIGLVRFNGTVEAQARPRPVLDPLPARPAPHPSRWRGTAWLFTHGNGTQLNDSARLGGSQAGARLSYPLAPDNRIAAAGRASTPLQGDGAEASVGVEWRPWNAPVALVAERRFGLDNQRGGPATAIVGGSGPAPLAGGFDLETYGEAGAVFRERPDYYAAGAARLSRKTARIGDTAISLGLGAWASMQREASRVDIGPSVSIPLHVADGNARLSLDWRQRVAGDASPGSGPALTLGADF
ncbi:hypothetical protein [Stakelama marina]|uniref:Uncharacterized protein n=1 Tax=Stakelama marina TaxID=2826939 RepID=A0A8T4IH02_9SPHN|nr:hypothetical protein [Stakelama marina]MBR0553312.1 hypothetical protein [Stakelama marina]